MSYNRRDFIRQVSAVLGSTAVAGTGVKLLGGADATALDNVLPTGTPILVMIELSGGNDMLNTHIPMAHPSATGYYRAARPGLGVTTVTTTRPYALPTNPGTYLPPALDLDGVYGFHGALPWLANRWWDSGDVAVVQGTGENVRQEMSHFAAMSYRWAGAFTGPNLATGWLGRYNDLARPGVVLGAIALSGLHQSLAGLVSPAVSITSIPAFNWSVSNLPSGTQWRSDFRALGDPGIPGSYNKVSTAAKALFDANLAIDQVQGIPAPAQSGSGLVGQLSTAAALIVGGVPCQTYVATQGGYDTHGSQPYYHYTQLAELNTALSRFFATIDASPRAGDVFVMITSEFGRQVSQNGSGGCDHGRASATILVGGGVKGGNYGLLPDLAPGARYFDALVPTVDFRSVWATVLNRLGGDPNLTEAALGRDESNNAFGDLGVFTTGPTTPPPGGGGSGTTVPPGETTTTMSSTSMPTTTMETTTTMAPPSTASTTTASTTTSSMPATSSTIPMSTSTSSTTTSTTMMATTTTRPKRTTTTMPRRKRSTKTTTKKAAKKKK